MDIAREGVAASRHRRRIAFVCSGAVLLAALVLLVLGLAPAAPAVDRATVFLDTVRRGEMLLSVRGAGTLVPVDARRVAAGTSGRVAAVHALPGVRVEPETVILTLENPRLVQELTGAELDLAAAEASLHDRRVQLRRAVLQQRSVLASVEAESRQAALNAEADAEIHAEGIIGRIALEDSQEAAAELRMRAEHERERLRLAQQVAAAELVAEEARVARLRAVAELQHEMVSRLDVRAGIAGVVQEVSVEMGQQVAPGDSLARVAEPSRLKAELRIAEAQAKDIEVGQTARVDTRNGVVSGRVTRVEPAVRDGAVTVDVMLTDELPRGTRSELSVEGLVEFERLGRCAACRSSGVRAGRGGGGSVPDCRGREPRRPCASAPRQSLGQHRGDPGGPDGRRHGDPLRHLGLGRARPDTPPMTTLDVTRQRRKAESGNANSSAKGEVMPDSVIRLSGISKIFHTDEVETHALSEISLGFDAGDYVAISGPSGCGKSTLLSILGLLDTPNAGEYLLNGRSVANLGLAERARIRNREVGFIFQAFNLIGDLTVFENVELPLVYRGTPGAERKRRTLEALERVGMSHRRSHFPSQLSGGQQQRVAVARAVVGEPSILLADEPTGNLDSKNGTEVMDMLDALHQGGATICMVTHDPRYAGRTERTIRLFDGRIVPNPG